jgi:uncharacterized NAD(P)/FAD-binding protein YdhS
MSNQYRIAIIGGGFSGTALAIQLLRRGDPDMRVTLIESGLRLGRGLVYGADSAAHQLNTPVEQMSLYSDEPDHFLEWNRRCGRDVTASDFLPREWFGDYVEDTLLETVSRRASNGPRFIAHVQTRVSDVQERKRGFAVVLDDGDLLECDAVIVATGAAPPADPLQQWIAPDCASYLVNPWSQIELAGIDKDETVLLLGTGHTMVDVALSLARRGHRGQMTALSRRGLLPRSHADDTALLPRELIRSLYSRLDRASLRQIVRAIRSTIDEAERLGLPWQAVIDALRPVTPGIWSALSDADRRRFLRFIRPYWDVSRHRLAPDMSRRILQLQQEQRLKVRTGKIVRARAGQDLIFVEQQLPGERLPRREAYDRIVNCTGGSFTRIGTNTLEYRMVTRGLLIPDPLGLGYLSGTNGGVFGARGVVPGLYLLGPACRPHWWEHTGVPELREQAARLAVELVERREDFSLPPLARVLPLARSRRGAGAGAGRSRVALDT